MKKTVIAIMGIAMAVIGICAMHGINDNYVAGQIEQMAGQVLIGEDYAYRINDVHYDADEARWEICYEKIDDIQEIDGMVLTHTRWTVSDCHYSTDALVKAYNNFASMEVLDI